jgi:hypothetical protein
MHKSKFRRVVVSDANYPRCDWEYETSLKITALPYWDWVGLQYAKFEADDERDEIAEMWEDEENA